MRRVPDVDLTAETIGRRGKEMNYPLVPHTLAGCYGNFTELTLSVSPSTSPGTLAPRWSFLSEAFSAVNAEETAEALEISEDNVKTRLHRGRATARGWLFQRVGAKAKNAFPFMGARCDRVVHNVFARLS